MREGVPLGGQPQPRPPAGLRRRAVQGAQPAERCFAKLKQFRAVATRYDKREVIY
jgi:hypothetical protein